MEIVKLIDLVLAQYIPNNSNGRDISFLTTMVLSINAPYGW